ncbi:hypothetical protein LAh6_117 [Aeromonas phage LAh_6]|uniref:Uncharacterized protein n=1 Tax=Aeromonas phage LAh_6 TaxID=2591030 RepID=A0A513ZZR1_9CAUD|nr:hypothetical protein HWC30_gp117 [Aeromonas phage LAh_6]QDH46508.1 hypothetical protein LAh6_117 [Aeromonas phage LAh_6]
MRYAAFGYKKGSPVSNDVTIYNGQAGCWGVLAGNHTVGTNVINQIHFDLELSRFHNGAWDALKPKGMSDEEFAEKAFEAINEGYLDYRFEMKTGSSGTSSLHLIVDNLSEKLRQRTMWILFTFRSMIQYVTNAGNAAYLIADMKMSMTLREKIILSQIFYRGSGDLGSGFNGEVFLYNFGGCVLYTPHVTIADIRALLRGGKYYELDKVSKETWSVGGGYKSDQNVQNIACAMNTGKSSPDRDIESLSSIVRNSAWLEYNNRKGCLKEGQLRKFIRWLKYYKKG